MFTDIYSHPINNKTDHISEKYICFYRKKSKTKVDVPEFRSGLKHDPDPNPYQNETDPQH